MKTHIEKAQGASYCGRSKNILTKEVWWSQYEKLYGRNSEEARVKYIKQTCLHCWEGYWTEKENN